MECSEHPCAVGEGCSVRDYSLSCAACPPGTASNQGLVCVPCPEGFQPALNGTTCRPCPRNMLSEFGTQCKPCAANKKSSAVKA